MLLFTTFCFLPHAQAMKTSLLKSFKKSGSHEYEMVGVQPHIAALNNLFSKKNLQVEQRGRLINLCISYPQDCASRHLFERVPPNYVHNGMNFVYFLFTKIAQNNDGYYSLVKEALKYDELQIHNKNAVDKDLALGILESNYPNLIASLLKHPNFDRNFRYGNNEQPLASLLSENYMHQSLLKVIRHGKFLPLNMNAQNQRPGFFILRSTPSDISRECFLAFMGKDIKDWNLQYLGLEDSKVLDHILRFVIQDKQDRLAVLNYY